jgi:hypothetical protein
VIVALPAAVNELGLTKIPVSVDVEAAALALNGTDTVAVDAPGVVMSATGLAGAGGLDLQPTKANRLRTTVIHTFFMII